MGKKKPIVSSLGQWAYPGEVTIIPSNSITMKGVGYPVLGVDNLGNSQMMMPGADYTFPGDYVTEYPQMQFGGMSKRKIDKILNQNKDLNFVQRMYQPNTPSIIIPGQPYPATHFMESANGLVYPTVVQMPDGSLQYLGDNAYNYANQTGEYIEFPNDRQARRFAKNYKKGTGVLEEFGKGGLTQWFAEEWTDVKTGKPCGRSGKEKGSRPYPACRPKKRVNETTPKTTSEMSSAEKAKFKREKTSGKRIDYNHKRRQLGGQEDSTMENIAEFFDPTGYTSWDDANRAYNEWKKSNSVLPSMSQALDMFGAVPVLGKFGKLKYLDPNSIKTAYKTIPWQQILNAFDTAEDEISKTKKKYGGWLEQYQKGGPFLEDIKDPIVIPTPIPQTQKTSFWDLMSYQKDPNNPGSYIKVNKNPNYYKFNSKLDSNGDPEVQAYQNYLNEKFNLFLKEDGVWNDETKKAYEKYVTNNENSTVLNNKSIKIDNKQPLEFRYNNGSLQVKAINPEYNPDLENWTDLKKLNPTLEEFRSIVDRLPSYNKYYENIYDVDNTIRGVQAGPLDRERKAQIDATRNYQELDPKYKQYLGKTFGTLPIVEKEGIYEGYSPSRIWTTPPGSSSKPWLGDDEIYNPASDLRYLYFLKPKEGSIWSDEKYKKELENLNCIDGNCGDSYLNKETSAFSTPSLNLPKRKPEKVLPFPTGDTWKLGQQAYVEMLNNPEILKYAKEKGIDLTDLGKDQYSPILAEAIIGKRDAEFNNKGVVIPHSREYAPVIQDPNQFDLAGYLPITLDMFSPNMNPNARNQALLNWDKKAKAEYFKRAGIPEDQWDEVYIHTSPFPINNYTPGKKYGGWLDQYQEGGFRYTPPSRRAFTTSYQQPIRNTSDNTRVVTPFTGMSDATRARLEEQRQQEELLRRSGTISQGKPETAYAKAKRKSSFVEQEKERTGSAGPLSYVLDVVNPATYAFSATDIADNTAKAAYNVSQGEFTAAGSNLLDAGLNTLDFIPVAKGSGKFLKGAVRYGDDVLQTSKMVGKPSLPKYKDVYRAEHAGFNQVATPQDITGRWAANSADEASYYVQNLKDPTTGKVMNAFSGEQVPVRIMKQRVPEYKYNQQFAEGMPEEARIMSMGPGRLSRTELDQVLGPGATKRFETNQFSNQDLAAMQTAPFLFNPNEGILDAGIINNLRQGKNTLSGRASVFATQNQAADYLLNQTKSKQNVSSLNKYLPFNTFQMGGMSIPRVNGTKGKGGQTNWLEEYQDGGESDIRMEPIQINTQQSPWYIRYPRKALRAIDNKLTDWGAQYAQRISDATGGKDWYKEANPFGSLALEFMNAPQYTATYAVTGKVQTPSEAMNIQNPYGAFLTDAVLDPTNLVGAGIAKNLGKGSLQNMVRSRMSGVRPSIQNSVDNIAIPNISQNVSVSPVAWQAQELPGLHLKSTMTEGPISKIVEPKTGLVNVEQALGIIGKESGGADKVALIKQALGENIPKKMDYNDFRKTVQDQLIPLEKQFSTERSDYGIDRLGYAPGKFVTKEVDGKQIHTYESDYLDNQTILFSNKDKFGRGSGAHGNPDETLGHAHYLIDKESPDVLTVTQIQSDAFQGTHRSMPKNIDDAVSKLNKTQADSDDVLELMGDEKEKFKTVFDNANRKLQLDKATVENFTQKSLLDKNHQERYLQELVDYAGKQDYLNKVRLPTSETAAKVQGYNPLGQVVIESLTPEELEIAKSFGYTKEQKTILKKYSEQPKTIKKLFGVEPKIVTDSKGNTWYEFDIPKKFKEGKGEIKAFSTIGGIGAAGAAASQLPEQKYGGWLNKYK